MTSRVLESFQSSEEIEVVIYFSGISLVPFHAKLQNEADTNIDV